MAVEVVDARLHVGRIRRGLLTGRRRAAAALAVVPLLVRARRTVLTELEGLDPEVDDRRITEIVLGTMFSDAFFHQALFTVGAWRQLAVPTMAPVVARGLAEPPAGATVDRLWELQEASPPMAPDDRRYTVATLCFEPVRVAEALGAPGLTAKEQRALFLFWSRAAQRRGVPIPEDQAAFRAWSSDYERRSYRRSQDAVRAAAELERAFLDRCAPGPLRPLGQQVLRAFADAPLLDAVGLPPGNPAMKRLTAAAVRAYLRGRRTLPGARTELLGGAWTELENAPVPALAEEQAVEQVDESRPAPSFRPSRRKVGG